MGIYFVFSSLAQRQKKPNRTKQYICKPLQASLTTQVCKRVVFLADTAIRIDRSVGLFDTNRKFYLHTEISKCYSLLIMYVLQEWHKD